MKKYVTESKEIKVFKWDGFLQTLLHNTTKNQRLKNFNYDNDSLFVNTKNGFKLCKIGFYVIEDSTQDGNYIIMSPTQLRGQYQEIK